MTSSHESLQAEFIPYTFHFIKPSGTSRGILHERKSWFLVLHHKDNPKVKGIGECAPLKELSIDDRPDFEDTLKKLCSEPNNLSYWLREGLAEFPAIKFGLETALLDFSNSGNHILYPSSFTEGKDSIPINGLIWMGDLETMQAQLELKIAAGFRCIKIKIGAIDFEKELSLLKFIRNKFSENEVELRVDVNGAFSFQEAPEKLERLAKLQIHSIEQPIKQGQWEEMAILIRKTPIPIALDEELIGVKGLEEKRNLIRQIKPQYIILKPTLLGGFSESLEWIKLADEHKIGWWVTSALESNIGLNAIAQWAYTLGNKMPQGSGTGQLYKNNFNCPLRLEGQHLFYQPDTHWDLPQEFVR